MKPNTSQLEILVFTNTSVSKRQIVVKKNDGLTNILSPAEELEKQCWAGLLSELLPEVISSFESNRTNYIWSITAENNFIHISMGAFPKPATPRTTLNPHLSLSEIVLN